MVRKSRRKKSRKRRSDRGRKRSRRYKSRSRIACSRKNKRPCINTLACHWQTGKGCKSGGSKASQAHLLLKKSRRSRRSRRSRKRRSDRGHKRSRKYKKRRSRRSRKGRPRKGVACSRKRKKPCIDNLACHWIIGKGCKAGIKKSRNKWGGNKGDIPLSARRDYIHTPSPIKTFVSHHKALKEKAKKMPNIDKYFAHHKDFLTDLIRMGYQDLYYADEIGTDWDPTLASTFETLDEHIHPNEFNNAEKEFIKAKFKEIQKSEYKRLREGE